MTQSNIHLVECPRDAMQGWKNFIATQQKIDYLNALLKVGFHTLDCGSFVSPKAIPQMADTQQVLEGIDAPGDTRLLVIVANERGALQAVQQPNVHYLGFPFSISETFQQLNTNSSMKESLARVEEIQDLCAINNKKLVIYLSMGFGNPYGDVYNQEILLHWAGQIAQRGIDIISLADTVGLATPQQVSEAVSILIASHPQAEIGVHLHSTPHNWQKKMEAAIQAGCTRFDGALKGIGGCPMANNELVGNMNTEWMIDLLAKHQLAPHLNTQALQIAADMAAGLFV